MRTIFFAPRDEPAPVQPDQVIAGRLVVGRFLGSFETPAYIGWEFEVRLVARSERSSVSQWDDVAIGV